MVFDSLESQDNGVRDRRAVAYVARSRPADVRGRGATSGEQADPEAPRNARGFRMHKISTADEIARRSRKDSAW